MTAALVVPALVLAIAPWAVRRSARRLGGPATAPVAGATRRPLRQRLARRPGDAGEADPALLLDLVAVALVAGAPVPTALSAVGSSWPGDAGVAMVRAARALLLGAPWDVAWTGAGGAARAVAQALQPAWSAGASPVPLLHAAAHRMRSRRRAQTRAAAGRLGVQLVVPLALCYLPAFVLVGLVPVVVSLARGLLG